MWTSHGDDRDACSNDLRCSERHVMCTRLCNELNELRSVVYFVDHIG